MPELLHVRVVLGLVLTNYKLDEHATVKKYM
jgi:hypothetical protein